MLEVPRAKGFRRIAWVQASQQRKECIRVPREIESRRIRWVEDAQYMTQKMKTMEMSEGTFFPSIQIETAEFMKCYRNILSSK